MEELWYEQDKSLRKPRILCALITYVIRVCTAKSSRANSLMSVDHNMVISRLFHCIEVVIDEILSVMVLTSWHDIADIARFYGVVAVLVHQLIGCIQMAFVVAYRT